MKRTSNSRSSLFLIELIIAILFFSLVSTVCLRAFARSHILTENARDLNAALMHVESTAELLRAGESVEAQAFYSSSWDTCEEKKAAYHFLGQMGQYFQIRCHRCIHFYW